MITNLIDSCVKRMQQCDVHTCLSEFSNGLYIMVIMELKHINNQSLYTHLHITHNG